MRRESVEGRFLIQGMDLYVTFRKGIDGYTEYEFTDGRKGQLPTVSRVAVKEAVSRLLKRAVQPIFIP